MTDSLLTIGRFAEATALTIDTLRHWDAEGLLLPANVDPATGYRRYRADQVAQARAVAALRDLELSIPAIRALLESDDARDRAAILAREKTRLEARTARLQRALHRLSMVALATSAPNRAAAAPSTLAGAPEQEVLMSTPSQGPALDAETHRSLGVGLFNATWDLLEVEDRTPAQDDELLEGAYASAYHWRQVGNAASRARSHWLLSRVYSVLSRGEPALHHARRAIAVLEAGGDGIEDWDVAAADEAMARALAVTGDDAAASEWKARAVAAAAAIVDEADRKVIEADLATLPG